MKKAFNIKYEDIISIENLLEAWKEFLNGKTKREDVLEFQKNLMSNIISLHNDLLNKSYKHDEYKAFNISDPKPRNIHKASVKDRILHRAIYRKLYPFFDRTFISDSFSCRNFKGTHKALNRFKQFGNRVSQNNTKTCWILKGDVKKCFASVDHEILIEILKEYIQDQNIICLLEKTINSFNTKDKIGAGLPLGNLTSQLFINVHLNKFDQFIKHKLKIKYYIRYADDFVIFSQNRNYILELIPKIAIFLEEELKLTLHPDKLFIKTPASGLDFLGWVHFSNHRVLRTSTKKKMFRNINSKEGKQKENVVSSYLGMLKWGDGWKLSERIKSL